MSLEDELRAGFEALERGDTERAASHARAALNLAPNHAGAVTLLGRLALASKRIDVALPVFDAVTQTDAPPDVWLDLAEALTMVRREPEALEAARRAAALDPSWAPAWHMTGDLLLALNRREAAAEAYARVLTIEPGDARAHWAVAMASENAPGSAQAQAMQALLARGGLAAEDRGWLHYGLAAIYKRAGEGKAFIAHVLAANAAQAADSPSTGARYKETFDRIEAAFTRDALKQAQRAEAGAVTPIYIVGAPRSGTTLAEQILSGCDGVAAGSEINFVAGVVTPAMARLTGRPFPERFERLSREQMTALAQPYYTLLSMIGGGARWVTDKTPYNYHALPFLPLLTPGAKIIAMQRDAMDACFSILQQPFEQGAPHTYDIGLLAYAYARSQQMMRRWEDLCGDAFMSVRYEDLVARPAEIGREMAEYCGVSWCDEAVDVAARGGAVHTFSVQQVRSGVHGGSVGAWRAYEAELAPLREALAAEGVDVG